MSKEPRTCSQAGCKKRIKSRGLCAAHYQRRLRYGDPSVNRKRSVHMDLVRSFVSFRGDECLLWPFPVDSVNGYPKMNWRGKSYRVNRVMCRLKNGRPINQSDHAAHSCGNKKCFNPLHLRWATAKENIADKLLHGTALMGENVHFSKLTESEVKKIKADLKCGVSCTDVAQDYGVSRGAISKIKNGKNWAWVTT